MLVIYDYDSNAILTEPLKNSEGTEILRGYTKLHTYLVHKGFRPRTHWLDNEASTALKQFYNNNHVEYQLVSPHMHRRNSAEHAIRTWKNNFVAGLCSTDDKFPMHLWDRLLQQSTLTLNLLRPSRRNPQVLAYTMLEGQFDFKKPQWPLLAPKSFYMKNRYNKNHGTPMVLKAGTWGLPWSIIATTGSIQTKQEPKGLWTRSIFFTKDHITVSIPYQCGRPSH